MKRIFTIFAIAVTFVMSVSAQNRVDDRVLSVDGEIYDVTGYIFRDGFNGVVQANWTYFIESPNLSSDWQEIYRTPNGYGMKLGSVCYEFNSNGIRCFESQKYPETWMIDSNRIYANFDENAIASGKECGYVYVSRNGKQHVIVYGN